MELFSQSNCFDSDLAVLPPVFVTNDIVEAPCQFGKTRISSVYDWISFRLCFSVCYNTFRERPICKCGCWLLMYYLIQLLHSLKLSWKMQAFEQMNSGRNFRKTVSLMVLRYCKVAALMGICKDLGFHVLAYLSHSVWPMHFETHSEFSRISPSGIAPMRSVASSVSHIPCSRFTDKRRVHC